MNRQTKSAMGADNFFIESPKTTEITPYSDEPKHALLAMAADIVSAYVSKNAVPVSELPTLIADIHANLKKIDTGVVAAPVEAPKDPAVPIKKSVTPDFMICLEDGKKFKSLKRHLSTAYGLTPQQYRAKWGLPSDYPMVAPNYAAQRSELAKKFGLGARSASAPAKTKAKRKAPAKKAA